MIGSESRPVLQTQISAKSCTTTLKEICLSEMTIGNEPISITDSKISFGLSKKPKLMILLKTKLEEAELNLRSDKCSRKTSTHSSNSRSSVMVSR